MFRQLTKSQAISIRFLLAYVLLLLVILPHIFLLTADLLDIFLFFQIILFLLTYTGPVILGLFMLLALVVDGVRVVSEVDSFQLV